MNEGNLRRQERKRETISPQDRLRHLLEDPENEFLTQSIHSDRMDDMSAREALSYAQNMIDERLRRTSRLESVRILDGVTIKNFNILGFKRTIDSILAHSLEIGRGGDGFVVIDKNEIRKLPPEICYKFALTESTPRGRNSVFSELALQSKFYDILRDHDEPIGVPEPFYAAEIGTKKLIAMEKLDAMSVEDLLRGKGSLPNWIDTDQLITNIENALSFLHDKHLFHRDMHLGNIMISQSPVPVEKKAYIIDFGLSTETDPSLEPYKSERSGTIFTYNDDRVILSMLPKAFKTLKKDRRI